MKTKIKTLLTLFVFIAHFAVFGQDTIVFSPFEKSQNIEKSSTLHVVEETKDFLLADAYNEESGIFLLNKKTDILYTIGFENLANSSLKIDFVTDKFMLIKQEKMASGICESHYTWDYIIDLDKKMFSTVRTHTFSKCPEEEHNECTSQLKITDRKLIITKDCSSKDEVFCKSCVSDGEYQYINESFVKVKSTINKHHFANSVFDMGEKTYLTDNCSFYFECDCCASHYVFDSDSTFVVVSPCAQDVSVSYGNYEVKDNQLYIHYSGKWTERYIISDEQDKAAEYAYRDALVDSHTEVFTVSRCENTTLYSSQSNDNIKLLRSKESVEKKNEYLKEVGLLNKLRK